MSFKDELEHEDESGETSQLWMLPFSTLMMVLMILFAALYVNAKYNTLEYEEALTKLESQSERLSRGKKEVELAQSMKKFIEEMNMEGMAEVSISAHAIKLKLASPVIFESGSAELKPLIMPFLVKLFSHLKNLDNTIIVEGHTDNVPISSSQFRSNWELSAARAFSVIYFYIQRGISPARLLAHGYGEFRPAYSNDSDFGRAMNRRIEITILRGGARK
jgi:chemotaxis protein MotB